MENESLLLQEKGYPIIKLYEDRFEIKAIDYWNFRTFRYIDIQEIKHYDPNDNWWTKLYMLISFTAQIFSKNDPWILKIMYKKEATGNTRFHQLIILNLLKLSNS